MKFTGWILLVVFFLSASIQAMAIDSTASGDWHQGTTWVGGVAPVDGDDVVIKNGHTVTMNEVLTVYDVANLTIENGGTLTHTANTSTEQYKVLLNVATNLTIDSGGAIDVSELGYAANQGPGESDGRAGASHGGEGGFGFQATTTHPDTYGSINNPTNLGSGSASHRGGGAIVITVGHSLTNNGTISATGKDSVPVSNGGGAGGSVNIETATIAGNGTIDADGGEGESGNAGGGGGGGRVSIRLTGSGADFSSVTIGNITAVGGPSGPSSGGDPSAAGTVHLKTAAQTYGDLIIRGIDVSGDAVTPLRDGTFQFDSITVTNFGTLAVTTNGVLNLTGTALHHDSTTNSITSRIVIGQDNGSLTLPASFSTAGILSKDGTATFAMTTDLTIESGGILTHETGSSTEDHKLNVSLTGNLTVDSGGAIFVARRGYTSGTGPGVSSGRGGPGHGGEGGLGFGASFRGTTYGSVTNPTTYGTRASYQNHAGGGAIIMTVSGALTNNGLISADGENALPLSDNGAGGAGGSVNLKVATIAGSGDVTANGGDSDSNAAGGGGGGRIAVRLTQSGATFASYGAAKFSASGGSLGNPGVCCTEDAGAAGTIYLKSADASYGDLVVDNADTTGAETLIPTSPTDTPINDVELRNEASVNLPTGSSFTVYGNWSNSAPVDAFFGGGSVVFSGATTGTVYGSSTFEILTVSTAGREQRFEAGTTNTATEEITLQGSAATDVLLRSTASGVQWGLNVAASVSTKTFQYLDVQDSDARPGTAITAVDSEDSGNNSNWVFSVVGLTNTWTGASSTTWSDGGNWSLGGAPTLNDAKVIIPTGAPLFPVLDGPVDVNELEIQASATLSINSQVLTVYGDASIAGTLIAAGSETVTFNADLVFTGAGSFTQAQSTLTLGGTDTVTFTPLNNTFYDLDIANSNTVTVTDGFTARDMTFASTSANVSFGAGFTADNMTVVVTDGATLTFTAGQTYTVNNHLQLAGASGNLITLTGGGTWDLDVLCFASVSFASVLNSDASGGLTIYAAGSTDAGGNSNWNFALGKVWAGATDDWGTAGNWVPSGVPGGTSQVIIDGAGTSQPRITSGTSIAGLTVVGINAAATLSVDMPFAGPDVLAISGDAEIRTNATLTHTSGSETYRLSMSVGGDLTINPGGAIDVEAQGYTAGTGPGVGNGRGGAGHGGQGGKGFTSSIHGTTYGSITNPVRHGSSSSYSLKPAGGGAIILTVGGALTNNGVISADGEDAENASDRGGGGAGGSINLTLGTLAGSSTISADGGLGDSNAAGGGGGGRVAIRLTQSGATFAAFGEANITADAGDLQGPPTCCGEEPAAAGTVYLETQAQGSGGGTLTINNTVTDSTTASTQIRPATDASADEITGATVVLTNRAAVLSTANETIGDLLIYENSFWTLMTYTVTVNSAEHSLEDQNSPGPGQTNRVDEYAQIIWVSGGIDPTTVIKFQ